MDMLETMCGMLGIIGGSDGAISQEKLVPQILSDSGNIPGYTVFLTLR